MPTDVVCEDVEICGYCEFAKLAAFENEKSPVLFDCSVHKNRVSAETRCTKFKRDKS